MVLKVLTKLLLAFFPLMLCGCSKAKLLMIESVQDCRGTSIVHFLKNDSSELLVDTGFPYGSIEIWNLEREEDFVIVTRKKCFSLEESKEFVRVRRQEVEATRKIKLDDDEYVPNPCQIPQEYKAEEGYRATHSFVSENKKLTVVLEEQKMKEPGYGGHYHTRVYLFDPIQKTKVELDDIPKGRCRNLNGDAEGRFLVVLINSSEGTERCGSDEWDALNDAKKEVYLYDCIRKEKMGTFKVAPIKHAWGDRWHYCATPVSVAISPDGSWVAVGYEGSGLFVGSEGLATHTPVVFLWDVSDYWEKTSKAVPAQKTEDKTAVDKKP